MIHSQIQSLRHKDEHRTRRTNNKCPVKRGRVLKIVDMEFSARDEFIVILPTEVKADVDDLLEKHRNLLLRKYRQYL
ncbi:hypothetical protein KEJ47_08525 [Candidatus Bathyarchaeota archaeon]|nr:hypothetical protein [Candidatus Bathyarchaeota archaeon]